jgi:hypothetical protein
MGQEDMEMIHLGQDRGKKQSVLNTVINNAM